MRKIRKIRRTRRKLRRTKKLRGGGLSKKEKEQQQQQEQQDRDRELAKQAKKELEEGKRRLVKAHKLAYEERRKREKFAAIEKYAKENKISFNEAFDIIRKEEIEAIVKYYEEKVSHSPSAVKVYPSDINNSLYPYEICYDKRWTDDEDSSGFSKSIYLCDDKYNVMEKGLPWPLSNLDKKKYNEMNKEYNFSWPEEEKNEPSSKEVAVEPSIEVNPSKEDEPEEEEPEETEEERRIRIKQIEDEKNLEATINPKGYYDLGANDEEGGARRKTKRSKTKRSKTKRSKTKRSKTKHSKTKRKNYI
jgi:hypothetical protein